jgi:hypothetical protein
LTPSRQGSAHRFAVHDRERQSPFCVHALPVAHSEQVAPPQSTSVSLPFLIPSEHGWTQRPAAHISDSQSSFFWHAAPSAHAGQLPPQSTSVSVPFFVSSWHATPFSFGGCDEVSGAVQANGSSANTAKI